MKKQAFNLNKYYMIQKEAILKRIHSFDSKLYLEFGGKLTDDYHASRVLPGFVPDAKLKLLLSLKDKAEVLIVVNCQDINSNKIRNDSGLTYEEEVDKLINSFTNVGLTVNSVVLSFYEPSPLVLEFQQRMTKKNIKVYNHYRIKGYPQNIPLILSDEGLGKNEYIETTKPLVVVTAPGPGSGKMATCLSQLYHDTKRGIRAGYAKYETFPVWNLPLKHPVNLAYEAATVDLDDVNMIDPYHLEAYNQLAVNYNRDVETFPLLKTIFDNFYGESPYKSPTDMGVNMIGFAIEDDEVAIKASKDEIIRRYYQVKKYNYLGKFSDNTLEKIEMTMNHLNLSPLDRRCVLGCEKKVKSCHMQSMAIELPNKKIVTGRKSELFSASAAVLLNALKVLAKIDDDIPLISPAVLGPINDLKLNHLKDSTARLHPDEVLIALAIQSTTNPLAEIALAQLKKLDGCQAHSSYLLHESALSMYKKMGVDVTEEPYTIIQ